MSSIADRIRRHLADPDSQHRKIAVGFVWISLFVLIGKLAGAGKEMAIAWRYGVSETVDAYVFVFNLVSLPVSVWFSVLTVVLVPLVARVRHDSPGDLPRFRGELLGLTLVAGVGLGVFSYWGLPVLFKTGWAGLSGDALRQALQMAKPLSVLLPMGAVISFFSAWMMACGRHRNTLLEAVPALIILAALLVPPGWVPEPLIWGTVTGFALQMAGLAWPLSRAGELQRPALEFRSPAWQGFWASFGIMAAGQTMMSITGIVDQFFAARLEAGAISTLSYANRIISLLVSLGAMAIGRATLPIFSELAVKRRTEVARAMAFRWAMVMFALGLLAMGLTWWFSSSIVAVVFQRGTFTVDNADVVTKLLRCLLLQLPFYFSCLVLVSLLSAQKKYRVIQWVAGLNLVVKVLAVLLLAPSLGIFGIALSTPIMYLASLVAMLILLNTKAQRPG